MLLGEETSGPLETTGWRNAASWPVDNVCLVYPWQVASLMKNEQQSQNLLLKVQQHSTFRNNSLQPATNVFVARQVDHARWKREASTQNVQRNNVARQVEGFCISISPPWVARATKLIARGNCAGFNKIPLHFYLSAPIDLRRVTYQSDVVSKLRFNPNNSLIHIYIYMRKHQKYSILIIRFYM